MLRHALVAHQPGAERLGLAQIEVDGRWSHVLLGAQIRQIAPYLYCGEIRHQHKATAGQQPLDAPHLQADALGGVALRSHVSFEIVEVLG